MNWTTGQREKVKNRLRLTDSHNTLKGKTNNTNNKDERGISKLKGKGLSLGSVRLLDSDGDEHDNEARIHATSATTTATTSKTSHSKEVKPKYKRLQNDDDNDEVLTDIGILQQRLSPRTRVPIFAANPAEAYQNKSQHSRSSSSKGNSAKK